MADLPASRGTEKGRYVYDPLDGRPDDTLRILHLQPGSGEDALQCSLSLARCSDKPPYAALSYVWETSKTTIMVDNQQLSVPASLSSFLSQLRHPRECLSLWADAICVDQENLKERGHQVQLMGHIYRNATVVHAWLGEDTCHVSSSIGVQRKIPTNLDTLNIWEREVPESEKMRPSAPQSAVSALETRQDPLKRTLKVGGNEILKRSQAWKAMIDICQRKYWTRLWIVQEFILARSFVLCIGGSQVSWVDFLRLVIFCGAQSRKRSSVSKEIRTWEEKWKATYCTTCPIYPFTKSPPYAQRKQSLDNLFELWKMQECKDSRDKVYALLFLAYIPARCKIRPNYEQCVISLYCEIRQSNIMVGEFALKQYLGVSSQQIQEHERQFPQCLVTGLSGQVCSILEHSQAPEIDTLCVEFSRLDAGYDSRPRDPLRIFAKVSLAARRLLAAIPEMQLHLPEQWLARGRI